MPLFASYLRNTFEVEVCEVQPHSFLLTQRPARIEEESSQKPKTVDGLLSTFVLPHSRGYGDEADCRIREMILFLFLSVEKLW